MSARLSPRATFARRGAPRASRSGASSTRLRAVREAIAAAADTRLVSDPDSSTDAPWRLREGAQLRPSRVPRSNPGARADPPKRSLLDLDAVERFARDHGIKKVHVASLYREIFRRGRPDFSGAPDVSARDAALFADNFVVCTSEVIDTKVTADGTGAKLVVRLHDGRLVETVVIGHRRDSSASAPAALRNTVCVSSQVGCAMGCTFCETGTMGLLANLTAGEIAEQVWHARRLVGAAGARNVVMMGMGEPLDNLGEVLPALRALTHQSMFDMRRAAVTVSTVGVPGAIKKLADEAPEINLALSLHAPTQALRAKLLPSSAEDERALGRLAAAMRYHRARAGRGAMIEYIVIGGVNDGEEHARQLGRFVAEELAGEKEEEEDGSRGDDDGDGDAPSSSSSSSSSCGVRDPGGYFVNLIPYNPTEIGATHGYATPSDAACERMREILTEEFCVKAKVRWSTAKGREVDGACGQLALKSMRDAASDADESGG